MASVIVSYSSNGLLNLKPSQWWPIFEDFSGVYCKHEDIVLDGFNDRSHFDSIPASPRSFFGHFSHRSEWQLIKIDYKSLYSRKCTEEDYQTWHLHNQVGGNLATRGVTCAGC